MATSRLDILINAKNNASGELGKLDSQLSGLGRGAGMVTKALGAFGLAMGAVQLGQFAVDAAQASAAAERLESSFRGLAGGAADEMLDAMRKMSAGMISDSELILSANKAMMLGVADSAEEMASLIEIAAERGQAMGLTTTQAFNDIVTGIGRQSALILDNLGIVIDTEKAYADFADQLGKTADELTDTEKKQAFLNATLSGADGTLDASVNDYERLGASFKNLKEELGELTGPAISAGVSALADALAQLNDELNKGQEQRAEILDEREVAAVENSIKLLQDRLAMLQDRLASTTEGTWQYEEVLIDIEETQAQLAATMGDYGQQLTDVARATDDYTTSLDQLRTMGAEAANAIRDTQNAMALMAGFNAVDIVPTYSDEDLANIAETSGRETGQLWSAAYNEAIEAGTGAVAAIGNADALLRNAQQQVEQLTSKLMEADVPAWQIEEAIRALIDSMIDAVRATGDLESAGVTAGSNIKGAMIYAASGVRILTSELSTALANLGNLGAAVNSAKSSFGEFAPSASKLGVLNDSLSEAGEIGYELERIYSPTGGIASGLSSIAGKIQGLLGVGGDTAGIKAEDLLPREDAVDENARRLADIAVNGFKGQEWLGEFAAEAPNIFQQLADSSNPQETAAMLLRDFQDGLLNGTGELIDKDAAKERVKRMILGEQNTAAMANEIAQELSNEMGISLGSAQQAASSVLGGGSTGSGEAIVAEVRAAEAKLKSAGADAGKQWGQWFLSTVGDGVPGELVKMLANLVTPHVQDNINTQASRAGAS